MNYIIVGLGNPGEEYEGTRHNAGRTTLLSAAKTFHLSDWREDKKIKALMSEGKMGKEKIIAVLPNTFMNRSAAAVAPLVKDAKQAERLIVIYDDLDLPLGRIKISFNKSAGGHRGLQSIIKALKTEKFARVRMGTSKMGAKGKVKKPMGEKEVEKHILGRFRKEELPVLKKAQKKAAEAVISIISDGREKAMSIFNK